MGFCFKTQAKDSCWDMKTRQFQSVSFLDLLELRRKLGQRVGVDPQTREETQYLGDCCTLTFFEFGLSMLQVCFYDQEQSGNLEYNYSVNEDFYLTIDILLLKENDKDSHCPLLATMEPSDMSRQEKRAYLTDESKKNKADKRKAEQKAKREMGKAKASTWGILFIRKDNFIWLKLSFCNLCSKNDELTMYLPSGRW